ncbi:hypothetical protein EDD16DRAFT_1729464 [Pisolithus croceorrhizus]|nr:hypothetical protein EDD16DRAFT_1729464 [Pisolithus croceorrhizus]
MGVPGGFGSILIAGLLSAMLYGVTVLQGSVKRNTYVYYMMHCSEDTSIVKFLVAATCILDTLHVSFNNQLWRADEFGVHCLVIPGTHTQFSTKHCLEYFCPQASAVVQLLIVIMVQLFFAHKIYRLCRPVVRWLVTAPIIIFVLAHYGFGMVVTVLLCFNNKMNVFTRTSYYSVTPSAVSVVVAEVLITVSLCVILYDGGSYSACPRAKRLINTITTYAANRCLLTSIVVIAELAVNVDQQALWTMGLNFIVGKLYTNSLLASLNAREHLWSQGSTSMSILNISSLHFADPPTLPKDRRTSQV